MAFKLNPTALRAAIKHLCRYGDTDVFPHLPELALYAEEAKAVLAELAGLDLDNYNPSGAIEVLAPKNRYGFRIAHQLPALDTLLLLACVVEIGANIESKRQPVSLRRAFSYRFKIDDSTGQLFRPDRTFKDWLHKQNDLITRNKKIKRVLITDISDYYARINFHRLENLLDEVAPGNGAARFIKKHIKIIRAKQSFGLPVGGSAARLLAELALIDTDQALRDKGLISTRYVDDFRVFLKNDESPYDALGYLAEHLAINEGLSLNTAKTSVISRSNYIRRLKHLTSDVAEEAEGVALDVLTANLYFDEEPDEEDLNKLKALNLVELLEKEIDKDFWDMGRIKVVFRALKIIKPVTAIDFILQNFARLVIFAKEICLLMEELEADQPGCFDGMIDKLIGAILSPPASSVQLIRTWLLEILVRGLVKITPMKLKKLDGLSTTIDRRQFLLMRGRIGDKNYFRKQKTAVQNFSDFELPCLMWGASCLPKDEYENWIAAIKSSLNKPLGAVYIKWLIANKTALTGKLKASTIEHPD